MDGQSILTRLAELNPGDRAKKTYHLSKSLTSAFEEAVRLNSPKDKKVSPSEVLEDLMRQFIESFGASGAR